MTEESISLGLEDLPERISRQVSPPKSSPLGGFYADVRNRSKRCWEDTSCSDESDDASHFYQNTPPDRWKEEPLKQVKFIDDVTALEKCDVTAAMSTFTVRKEERLVNAAQCQDYYQRVK